MTQQVYVDIFQPVFIQQVEQSAALIIFSVIKPVKKIFLKS